MNRNYRPLTVSANQRAIPIHTAVENSEALGLLSDLVKESSERFTEIRPLIPEAMRSAVKAGPINGDVWCLLVSGNAAAAKLRQLSPLILAELKAKGRAVTSIRLKILP